MVHYLPEIFVVMNIEYEGRQRKRTSRQNLTSTEFQYDRGGHMIGFKHDYKEGILSQLQYLYDAVGNIRQKTE